MHGRGFQPLYFFHFLIDWPINGEGGGGGQQYLFLQTSRWYILLVEMFKVVRLREAKERLTPCE